MLADQIQITFQAAIRVTEPPIDTSVLKRAKDSTRQHRDWKQVEDVTIVERGMRILRMVVAQVANLRYVTIQCKSITRVLILRIVKLGQRGIGSVNVERVSIVSSKLNLPRRMRGQHFVESKVQFFIAKFRDDRRQVNRAAIADARLDR